MLDQQFSLQHIEIEELLELVQEEIPSFDYQHKKHLISLLNDEGDEMGYIRLPLHFQLDEQLNLVYEDANALYLSIESGNAAICMMEGKESVYHTTFSAYMTRKKQGFSQIKYLNKKGKSRAGSRIRLSETVTFFENINATMNELCEEFLIDRIALDCSKTLLPYLFQSKVEFPIEKDDSKLYKIPMHIAQSNYTNLIAAIEKLQKPLLLYNEAFKVELESVFMGH